MAEEAASTKETKGERTARRVMDVAEDLFALHGFEGTSLRQIARGAGIKEPGLYNHFASKQALYEAVLYRALNPMAEALSQRMDNASHLRDYTDLPAVMTDILLEHPQMAALFQQAMQGDAESVGNRLVSEWLERLFDQGMRSMVEFSAGDERAADELLEKSNEERASLAINLIAMFNLTTGYFLSQRAFETMAEGQLTDPDNIARHKQLLRKVIRAMLIN